MQPNLPVAFLGAFLVALVVLVGVLATLFEQIIQLSAP